MDRSREWPAKVRWIQDGSRSIMPLEQAMVKWDQEKKCLVLKVRKGPVVTFPKNGLFLPPKMPIYTTLLLNAQQLSANKSSNTEITLQFLGHEILVDAYEYLKNFLNVGLPQQSASHRIRSGGFQQCITPPQQCRSGSSAISRSVKTISSGTKTSDSLFKAASASQSDSRKSSDGQRTSLTPAMETKQLRSECRQPVHTSDSFYGSQSTNLRPKTPSSSERTPAPPKRRRTLMSVLTDIEKTESANKNSGKVMAAEEAVLPSHRRLSPSPTHNQTPSSMSMRGTSFRRRISDVHETLVCTTNQSPTKSPIKRAQFASPLLDSSGRLNRGGFANLGATCYMNAVLQAMFSVEAFSKELFKLWQRCNERFKKNGMSIQGIELLSALSKLACRRYVASSEQNRTLLKGVMEAIRNDTFSENRQEDAQEFMAHVFDQVSDECSKVISERLGNEQLANDEVKVPNNPVITNFMFKIQNYIVCESCGHTSKTSEESTSLPIDFAVTDSRHEESPLHRIVSIQTMLDDCLRNEKVEHRCDSCGSNSAEIKHKFQKIPRCLVMYLKRYTFEGVKRTDNVEIPLYVTLKGHCTDTMESYEQVPLSTTKIDLLSVDSSIEREDLLTPQKSQPNDSEKVTFPVTSPTDENDDSHNLCTPLNVSKIDSTCRASLETLQRNHHRRSSSNVPRRLWSSSNSNDIPEDLRNESVRTAAASERRCRSSETRSGSLTPLKQADTLAPYKSANLSKLLATESCVRDVESPQLPEIILPPSDESVDSPMPDDDITPPLSSTKKSAQKSASRSSSSSPHVVIPSVKRQHLNSTNIDASRRCSLPYATPKRVRKGPFTDEELAQMSESEQMKAALELSIRTAESGEVGVIAKDCEQTLTEADEAEWRLATEMAVAEDENMNKITEGVDVEESARLAQEPAATPQDVPLKKDAMKTPKSDHLNTSAQSAVLVYEHRGSRSIKSKAITNAWRAKACKFLRVKMADEIVYPAESEEVEMSLRDRPARCGTVAGDGNCLFRALAFAITGGSDRQHAAIRQCITSFELGNEDRFRVLVEKDAKTWEDHVDALISDGSWGGSSELTAIATMLRIEVWTFLDGRWVCYAPRFQKGAERDEIVDIPINEYQLGSRPAIYLLNEHCHYSPVIELSNKRFLADQALERRLKINADSGELKPSYRLVSVVSHYGSSSYSGHYVCDVWNQKQSEWLHCDDSSVSEISEKNVRIGRTTTGYLFFYMARDVLDEEAV